MIVGDISVALNLGISITIIDNERDGFDDGETWAQRLFFNQNGELARLTGQRKSDYQSEVRTSETGKPTASTAAADRKGLNMVLMIQVPLKQKKPMTVRYSGFDPMDYPQLPLFRPTTPVGLLMNAMKRVDLQSGPTVA